MIDGQVTMSNVWEAFSTLSDAQELISMGRESDAIETINHAKRHLDVIFQQYQNLLKGVMLGQNFGPCELNPAGV